MLAIIPARGGSKGLPRKNVMLLDNKPLIAHTILAAQQAKLVSKIVVSTDDDEIATISKDYGAEVPFLRPAELASDNSPAIDTYLFTVNKLDQVNQTITDQFLVLLPTSPLRKAQDIDNAIELFLDKEADSVISYTEEQHPIYWHKKLTKDGRFTEIFNNDYLTNRQNLEKTFYPNGSIYVFNKRILELGKYYGENSYAYLMPRKRSVDIDTIDDFELAAFYLQNYDA